MRNVLFIAYDFPPAASAGASLRSVKFAKYLNQFGWQPLVLSLDPGHGELPDDNVVRVKSRLPVSWPFNLSPYGWSSTVAAKAAGITRECTFDLVYVTCPPFPPALGAATVAEKFSLPLVVDFRDAWSLSPYSEPSRVIRLVSPWFYPKLERHALCRAAAVLLNTPSALAAYRQAYPQLAARMHYLPNGYDEADFTAVENPAHPRDRPWMTLMHAGGFTTTRRDPDLIFNALAELNRDGMRAQLKILGQGAPPRRLGEQVTVTGRLSHADAVQAICNADALLVYQRPSAANVTAVAGKTYEYLRAGRAILAVAPPGDNIDLVSQFAVRSECVTDFSHAATVAALKRLYNDWQAGNLQRREPSAEIQQQFERRHLCHRLASIFDNLVD